ncbi:MFS transporter [Pigmentiphaga litoralis]|uniref:Sugar phosphate permease n=1 Tax=Pigmentiphaga litoralis TaxID=516702 RepID=A0A7Y9IVY2_9BURK|nr:MFS transporter [Pigmentiphaga litoralis]NYE22397.1 sugar phosphate permease [Pigmentiphaga litoralis]NYE83988.1 sugar phosphate permease [Pigmentiphaga litoralis]
MFALPLSRWLARRHFHYAWVIAGVAFLTMLTTSAALGLPGAMLLPLSGEFGWNTEQISSALALRFALFGLMGPFAAVFMERNGLRAVVTTALALVAGGLVLSTGMSHFWQLVTLWGLVLGVGSGMTALVLGAVVANRWFDRHRGLVIGVLTASSATGQLAFLPLAAWLIQHHGWRWAVIPTVIVGAIVAVLAVTLLRSHPRDLGLAPYGADDATVKAAASAPASSAASAASAASDASPPPRSVPDATAVPGSMAPPRPSFLAPFSVLRSVSGNRTFWVLAGTFFICGLSTNGLIQTHFITLCGDFGMAAVPAASVLALMGAFDFVGTILSGWLSDRYDSRKLLFWYYGLRALSLFWLPHSTFTLYGLSLFAMFYGLDWIATVPPTVKLAAAEFGRERTGVVFGWIFAAHQLGAAVAAYGAGLSRTLLMTYTPALYGAGIACLIAAVLALTIRRMSSATVAPPRPPVGDLAHP